MSFQQSIRSGQLGEELLRNLLLEASIPNQANPERYDKENLIAWDVEGSLFGVLFHIEAKFDLMECKTHNVAIEYFNPKQNKVSGIMATKAELWAIILNEPVTIWLARTDELKKYVEQQKCVKDIKAGGDGNASLKLFNRDSIFGDIFHRIDELPPWDLSHLLVTMLGTEYERARDKVLAKTI